MARKCKSVKAGKDGFCSCGGYGKPGTARPFRELCNLAGLPVKSPRGGGSSVAGLDDWNIAAIREFTDSTELPWVIARNRDELSLRLAELIEAPARRATLGASSRRFMTERWNERRILRRLLAAYDV